jgi:hypothetical protein
MVGAMVRQAGAIALTLADIHLTFQDIRDNPYKT